MCLSGEFVICRKTNREKKGIDFFNYVYVLKCDRECRGF